MPIKKVAIKNVVNGCQVVSSLQNGKRKMTGGRERPDFFDLRGRIYVHRQKLQTLISPPLVLLVEKLQVFLAFLRFGDPEIKQYWLTFQSGESLRLTLQVRKHNSGSSNRSEQPGFNRGGKG